MWELINTNLIMMAQQMRQNPMKFLASKYNIPENINSPQDIVQHLLNTGQVSQSQVDAAMQMKNNPMFKGLMN